MEKLNRFAWVFMSSVFIWFSVIMVKVIGGNSGLTNFAIVMAILGSLALWLTVGFVEMLEESTTGQSHDKAKRQPGGEDARLALLVQLMDEEERQAVKRRLIDDLGADGEAVSLADLLADQQESSNQRRS